jgi:DNA-directed RNA polymerase specialized sigma24 family protein
MSDPQIAADLRARLPGALAELFDAYGDRLFRYCWCMLRNREIAQTALRDTLIVAEAHIARLADPELLGPWLYSLARAECRRRRAVQPSLADEPPARPSQRDADSRLMAWNAVMSMAADEREALDLSCRHDVDLGLALGLATEDAQALLNRARQSLERALGAEILIRRGSLACPGRAEVMSGWAGTTTPEMAERMLEHAAGCQVCGPSLPRNVSAARVFALLPAPALAPLARAEVLGFFEKHGLAAYRELAVNRTAALTESGFPVTQAPVMQAPVTPAAAVPVVAARAAVHTQSTPRPGRRPRLRLASAGQIIAGAGTIAAAAAIACAFVLVGSSGKPTAVRVITPAMAAGSQSGLAGQRPDGAGATGPSPVGPGRPQLRPSPRPAAGSQASGNGEAMITDVTQPLAPAKTPAPTPGAPQYPQFPQYPQYTAPTSASAGTLAVSPDSIALGAGSSSQITLTAAGGPVSWSASASTAQVSLSSDSGTLQAGQTVTLDVTVTRGPGAGSSVISIEPPAASPQTVDISWTALPKSSSSPRPRPRRPWRPRPSPSPSPSTPTPTPSASASSLPCAPPRPVPATPARGHGRTRPAAPPRPLPPAPARGHGRTRPAVPQALSWRRDHRASFAYRPGQTSAPDQQGTSPAVSRRLLRTGLQFPA